MKIKGVARLDRKTKHLVQRLKPYEIAIIDHPGLDEVAAFSLVSRRVQAVINAGSSLSDRFPNRGPSILLEAGIPVLDQAGQAVFDAIAEGDEIAIINAEVWSQGRMVATGTPLTLALIEERQVGSRQNLNRELERFVTNTLEHARREAALLLNSTRVPATRTVFQGRHALIVVRGQSYRDDLAAIRPYIDDIKPVLIGVDGGADALLEFGCRPDLIIGDMDSVSDRALKCGAELIVHAYPDGTAPGMARVKQLGLKADIFSSPGTSEDVALLLAYENKAELLVAVGTHSNMIDFLEKGRGGMSSTLLVRLKVGIALVDARGVSKLYRRSVKLSEMARILAASFVSLLIIFLVSPLTRSVFRLLALKFRLALNI